MWNHAQDSNPPTPPPQPRQPGAPADPYAAINWTQDQLGRMENEWRRLQRAFAYHPHVTLTPLTGDPPAAYQIDFRLTTVIVNPRTSQLEYVANASVQVLLQPGFPDDAPTVRPMTAIFHPNVSYEGLFMEGLWHPNETLLGLIRKVGDVLAYRSYDPDYAVNSAAMEWLVANHSILPIDQQANLSPQAGGEPLERICKYGPQSLESMKQSIVATQAAMLGNSAPDLATLRNYAAKTRMALNLFTENDVPEHLQSVASELDAAARELLSMAPLYDFVRERRRRIAGVRQAVKQLSASKRPLVAELEKLEGLADASDPPDAMAALKLIPPTAKLQPLQFSMPKLIDEAEKRLAAIKAGVASLDQLPHPALAATDSLLGQVLDRELNHVQSDLEAVKTEAADTLADVKPVLSRAASEATALEFAIRWREYLDMADKARLIERGLREWGSEGLQAYYVENAGGRYGPFQLEQSIDMGAGEMLIRNNAGKMIELWDHHRDRPLATNASGVMAVALPAPAAEPGEQVEVGENGEPLKRTIPTRFSLTERCDDLVVLLDFLRRSTIQTVQKFAAYNGDARSWAGTVCRMLSGPEVKKALEEELAGAARRWRHMIIDLAALGPWKERLATYLVLQRAAHAVPQLLASINDARQKQAVSKKKVNEIMSKCGRDVETGSMIVPPRYSRQYQEELKLQEQCATTLKVSTAKLKSLVAQVTARLQNPKRLGRGTIPALRALPALPQTLTSLPLADGQIGELIVPMEELLQLELGGPRAEVYPAEQPADQAYGGQPYAEEEYGEQAAREYPEGAYAEPGVEGEGYEAAQAESPYAGAIEEAVVPDDASVPGAAVGSRGGSAAVANDPGRERFSTADLAATGAGSSHAPPEAEGDVMHEFHQEQWVVQDDEGDSAHGEFEQSDIAFGFDSDPTPPPASEAAK